MLDKAWVHLRRADPAYERGAWSFVNAAASVLGDGDMVICPCRDCQNLDRHQPSTVVHHLVTKGMDEGYKLQKDWFHHGELNSEAEYGRKATQWNDEIIGLFQAAEYLDEELVQNVDLCEVAEGEDKEEDEFLAKVADAETPLYPNCSTHSKLSAIVSLYRLKTQNGWSDKSFNELLETLPEMLPAENVLHTSFYDVKKFLKSLDIGYVKIHACVNDCILFRKKYKMVESCPKCKASRWKTNMHSGEVKKGVPQKVLRYFPIIPRLKRMYRSEEMAKTIKDRMELRPKNIQPGQWRKFVNQKTNAAFKAVSDSYKERRQKQIPHTVSRKGIVRLTEEMKKNSSEPSEVTRLKVWIKSRTKKNGTPVNNQAAEKIQKANDVASCPQSSTTGTFGNNDALTQILGPDNPGRLRAMGRGMSKTKLACYQVKSAYVSEMQDNQAKLQKKVQELEAIVLRMNNLREDEQGETSGPRSVNKTVPAKCLLVDWSGTEETVAEGRLLSSDSEEYVNETPLGPNNVKVLVEAAIISDACLWRPTANMTTMEEAVGHIIAWKAACCIAADNEVIDDVSAPKSPYLSSKNRCTLMDWDTNDKPVAEGRWQPTDPDDIVNGIPIGRNAVKVYVDAVLSPNAFPWRPTSEITSMEQTLNSFVAWPANRVVNETHTVPSTDKYPQKSPANSTSKSKSPAGPSPSLDKSQETPRTSTAGPIAPLQTSPPTPKAPAKKNKQSPQPSRKSMRNVSKDNKKCNLMDITGKKRVVAEGRWASNDPNQTVHFVPLGADAVRVWVDVVKIKSAAVWRTSSEIETMEDALGTSIAWPEDKVVMCSED